MSNPLFLETWYGLASVLHVNKMSILAYKWVNNGALTNALFLNLCITHLIFVTRHWHMYNIRFIKESRWPQPSFKYQTLHRVILRHYRETIINFDPKYNCQYYMSSYVRKWQNTLQRVVDHLTNVLKDKIRELLIY